MNVLRNINGSKKHFKCQICGIDIVKYSNAQKYCKACARKVHKEQKKKRKKNKLSKSHLSEHFSGDFDKEHTLILKEFKDIGFKRQFT